MCPKSVYCFRTLELSVLWTPLCRGIGSESSFVVLYLKCIILIVLLDILFDQNLIIIFRFSLNFCSLSLSMIKIFSWFV